MSQSQGLRGKGGAKESSPPLPGQPGQEGWLPWQTSRPPQWLPVPVWQLLGGMRCLCVPSFCPLHPKPEKFPSIEDVCWGLIPGDSRTPGTPARLPRSTPNPAAVPSNLLRNHDKRSGPATGVLQQPGVFPLNLQRKQAAPQSPGPEAGRREHYRRQGKIRLCTDSGVWEAHVRSSCIGRTPPHQKYQRHDYCQCGTFCLWRRGKDKCGSLITPAPYVSPASGWTVGRPLVCPVRSSLQPCYRALPSECDSHCWQSEQL